MNLKTGGDDLLISLSAVTSVFGNSFAVASSAGQQALPLENVGVRIRVLVDSDTTQDLPPSDPFLALPGEINWDTLARSANAFFLLSPPTPQVAASNFQTFGARSYTFLKTNLGGEAHTVNAQSRFCYQNRDNALGGATSNSTLGAMVATRVLTVEETKVDLQ